MNEFGNDENKETEKDASEVIVPKPSVDLPQGFTPLVPSSTLEELESLPESPEEEEGDAGEEIPLLEEEEENASGEPEMDGDELRGPDVESIFAKVEAESEGDEAGEEGQDDLEVAGFGGVGFTAPNVKPVMLNAASVYGASPADEVVQVENATEEVIDEVVADSEEETPEDGRVEEPADAEEESEVVLEEESPEEELVEDDEEQDDPAVEYGESDEDEPNEDGILEEEPEVDEIAAEEGGDEADEISEEETEVDEVADEDEEISEEETELDEVVAEEPDEKERSVLESLAYEGLEEVAQKLGADEEDSDNEEDEEEDDEVKPKVPDAAVVAGLVAKAKENQSDEASEMEVMDPEREKTRELFQPENSTSRWAFWRRPSKRDQQLARVSEGYLEMVDMVRAIRNQMNSQNENNLILRDSLSHLPEAMKGLESFSKSQRTVGKALKEIHGQLRNSGSKDQKLIESMVGFNDTLKGMDDTGKETMKTFDRVQERMRDSDIRMENLFQNVQNTEEKVGDTMVRLQRNMAIMQSLFLFCLMIVIGVLVYTVMGNNDEKSKTPPAPVIQEKVVTPPEEE